MLQLRFYRFGVKSNTSLHLLLFVFSFALLKCTSISGYVKLYGANVTSTEFSKAGSVCVNKKTLILFEPDTLN
jgi:hypothetical protein